MLIRIWYWWRAEQSAALSKRKLGGLRPLLPHTHASVPKVSLAKHKLGLTKIFHFVRVKICVRHWLLLTLETTLIKTYKTFRPNNFVLHRFFLKPTEWRLCNGSQFCACYASKNITNDCCAWLCKCVHFLRCLAVLLSTFCSLLEVRQVTKIWENMSGSTPPASTRL